MPMIPVAEGLFTWPLDEGERPRLLGSRCLDCGTHAFPAQEGCARCTGSSTEVVELEPAGRLWAWTVQGFPPKAPPYLGDVDPATFTPFGVGYVELAGQVRVEARLTESDPERLRVGMPMELVLERLAVDADGNEQITFAFAPCEEQS